MSHFLRTNVLRTYLFAMLAFAVCVGAYSVEDVREIPNPRINQNWVVDLTDTLTVAEFDRVNQLCESVYQSHGFECAVVIIRTIGSKSVEQFATQLFNFWKIGDANSDNGVLFLVAKNDRKMRIELGDGIDDPANERAAKKILDNVVTPQFRSNKFGSGIYRGTSQIVQEILKVPNNRDKDTAVPPALPQVPLGNANTNLKNQTDTILSNRNNKHPARRRAINDNPPRKDGKSSPLLPFLFGGGALGVGGLSVAGMRRWMRYRARDCDRCNSQMVMLDEVQDDDFLNKSELLEENLGSADYDVWACLSCEEVVKHRYGAFFTRYSRCPKCTYQTKFKIKKTIRAATRYSGGLVSVEEQCKNCPYYNEYQYSTPKLPPPSDNNSGFGSSGGGFSSSGGFGGGSSSGGGASGGW